MPKLSPSQRAKIRRQTRVREPDPSESSKELNIVPLLDIVVNLMLFLLATTASVMAIAQADAELPSFCRGAHCHGGTPSLQLSVTVAEGSIIVATRDGRLAAGCEGVGGSAPTIAGHDWSALDACLARMHEEFPDEETLILSADPSVPYEDVIHAMDAARGEAPEPRFERVQISAGVR
ncbi:MAG: ExbD/TolR family protein [Sandaracinaceae bacterium]